uniref:Carboxylic ester hydrolase n=1 Tax=Parastrongyloides trichosuri TaxID=131310 RepID=A0A0N4ZJG9_PARTI
GEDTEAKGNVGLLDQQEGLKWISKNIEYFGGNKSDITLFGESAGAASATAHLLANKSHSYFNKIIVNSGAITNVWATVSQKQALNNTLWLAKLMNCSNINSKVKTQNMTEVLKCMQKENVNLTAMNNIYQFDVRDEEQPPFPYPFLPMYNDTVFFNESIFKRLKYGDVKKNVPAMYGRTAHEGSLFLPFMLGYEHGCGYNYSLPANATENKCVNISSFTVFASWYELGKFYKASLLDRLKLGFKYLDPSMENYERKNK